MAGTLVIVVGLLLRVGDIGESVLSVIFGTGLGILVLSLGIAFAAKTNFVRLALIAGLLGASGGIVAGFFDVLLLILSLAALIGVGLATQAPKVSVPLMSLPAIIGLIAVPILFWIPATLLLGASFVLVIHLIWENSAKGDAGAGAMQGVDGNE